MFLKIARYTLALRVLDYICYKCYICFIWHFLSIVSCSIWIIFYRMSCGCSSLAEAGYFWSASLWDDMISAKYLPSHELTLMPCAEFIMSAGWENGKTHYLTWKVKTPTLVNLAITPIDSVEYGPFQNEDRLYVSLIWCIATVNSFLMGLWSQSQ